MRAFLIDNFNPRAFFSWPVFLISLGWASSTNLLDVVYNPSGLYFERLSSVLLGHLGLFLILFISIRFLRLFPQVVQAALMIPLVILACMFRGFIVWLMLNNFGIDSSELFNYRVFGSITNLGPPLTLSAIAINRIRAYSETRRKLLAENKRLLELKNTAQEQIRQSGEARLSGIRTMILNSLGLNNETNPDKTMLAISDTIDRIVRPLSHQIDSESGITVSEVEDSSRIRINWREAIKGAVSPNFLNPAAVGITVSSAAIIFVTSSHSILDSIYLLSLLGFGSWSVLLGLRSLLSSLSAKMPSLITQLLLIVGIVSSGLIVGTASLLVTLNTERPFSLFFLSVYFITGLSILFALAGSTQSQAIAANERLAETTANLAWEVARVSNEQRQLRRALSTLLHGRLQSGLTSSLLRLKMAASGDPSSLLEAEQTVRGELRELLESMWLNDSSETPALDQILDSLNSTWQDIATVSFEVGPSQREQLASDPILMNTISELFSELTFNSIRHGEASKVAFEIIKTSDNTFTLSCSDNGTRPSDSSRIGLGTKLIDECALEWSRESTESGTKTTLRLPFASSVILT